MQNWVRTMLPTVSATRWLGLPFTRWHAIWHHLFDFKVAYQHRRVCTNTTQQVRTNACSGVLYVPGSAWYEHRMQRHFCCCWLFLRHFSSLLVASRDRQWWWRRSSPVWRDYSRATTHCYNCHQQLSTSVRVVVCLVSAFREVKSFSEDCQRIIFLLRAIVAQVIGFSVRNCQWLGDCVGIRVNVVVIFASPEEASLETHAQTS